MRLVCLPAAILLASSAVAQSVDREQARITGAVQIGQFVFGKSSEDILAAHPDVAWDLERFENSTRIRLLRAKSALSLAGQRFDVLITPDYDPEIHGGYEIAFGSYTAASMDACQRNIVQLVGALENTFGFFSERNAGRGSSTLKAGRKSRITADKDTVNAMWNAERDSPFEDDGYSVRMHAFYNGKGAAKGCTIEVRALFEPRFAKG